MLVLVLALMPGSAPAQAGEPPLKLQLRVSLPGIHAMLINGSGKAQPYLHHLMLQHCELELRDAAGKAIKPRDSRSVRSSSGVITRTMYRSLAPRKETALVSAVFHLKPDGRYSLSWGPLVFHDLAPGRYKATARWVSTYQRWSDPLSRKQGKVAGIWKGKLRSAAKSLELLAPRGSKHPTKMRATPHRGNSRTRRFHRPDCRHARRATVQLHGVARAVSQGYRPCKRCRPVRRFLRKALGPPPPQPRQARSPQRACKRDDQCEFRPRSACHCEACGYWWRRAVNRRRASGIRRLNAIKHCARRRCRACPALEGLPLALGRKVACVGGQCTVLP